MQLKAYNIVKTYLTTDTKQLGLFLTGEGGTGKSKVIEAIVRFSRNFFGKTDGIYGPIIVTAPTGTSSNNINGFTNHSVCGFSRRFKNISAQSSQRMGKKIAGAKIIIIDEISLVSLEDFYLQHLAYSRALSTLTDCNDEKTKILSTPFGGLHVIFVGDFYQFNNAELSIFAKFLHHARTGNSKVKEYIDDINRACLDFSPNSSSKCNNPNILWLADTNKDVSKINHQKLHQLLRSSPVAYRVLSRHTSVQPLIPAPNADIREKLYKIAGFKLGSLK